MKSSKKLIIGLLVVLVVVVGVVAVVAGGSKSTKTTITSTPASTSAPSNAVATNTVSISNYMFSPMAITVKAGTTVTWTNKDSVHHTVTGKTASDGIASPQLAQNQSYSVTFEHAGTYSYYCQDHPYMTATVTVT
jgi:amicyanin